MGGQLCTCDTHVLAMSFMHDLFCICTFLASHPLHLAYLLFFSPYIFSFLAFFYPLLVSTSLLLLVLITITPYLGHSPQLSLKFLGRTCGIALSALCAELRPDGAAVGLLGQLCSFVLAPDLDAVLRLGEIMGELYCTCSSCFALEEKSLECEGLKESNGTGEFLYSSCCLILREEEEGQQIELALENAIEEKSLIHEVLEEIKDVIEEKVVVCQDYKEFKECKFLEKNSVPGQGMEAQVCKDAIDCIEEQSLSFEAMDEIKDGNEEKSSEYDQNLKEIKECEPLDSHSSIAKCVQELEAQICDGAKETLRDNARENLLKFSLECAALKDFKECDHFETDFSIAKCDQDMEAQECKGTQESIGVRAAENSPKESLKCDALKEFQEGEQFGTSPPIAQCVQESLVGNAGESSLNSKEFQECEQSETSPPIAQCVQESLVGNAGENSPNSTSIVRRVHSRSSSESLVREASIRREKEWKRTLACKLYEERMQFKLCEDRAVIEGGENMDMLWEAYELNGGNAKNTDSKEEVEDMNNQQDEEEEEEEGPVRQLCCLRALKFSTSKMNLGVGKSNLVKFSKVLRRMTVFSSIGSHRNRKG